MKNITAIFIFILLSMSLLAGCTDTPPETTNTDEAANDDTQTTDESTETDNEEENDNESAIYQFEPTIQFFEEEQRIHFDSTTRFIYYAYVSWDPYPYVRYYEMKFHFNSNPKTVFDGWGCAWRDRGKAYCGVGEYLLEDEITYYLAPTEMRGDFKDYLSTYDFNQKVLGTGKHGFSIINMHDDIDDDEELSAVQQNQIKDEIRQFIQDYVHDWTVTVRPVAAQSDGT